MSDIDEEDYFLPLEDQRVFGAGIKRKRITFVAASDERSVSAPPASTQSAGDRYLSIVLGTDASQASASVPHSPKVEADSVEEVMCPVCNQPVASGEKAAIDAHENSIAHQVCMDHSHPPSHLDRSRAGMKYLSAYGWDPDARKGLGAREEGIRMPIKARAKRDTAGLSVSHDDDDQSERMKPNSVMKSEAKVTKLNLKEVRKLENQKRQKAEKLRQAFYGEDLSQYLGPGA